MEPVECVAFMLIQGNTVLAEQRKLDKQVEPGVIALPGGHIEEGEKPEQALRRESSEELGISPSTIKYVCSLLHPSHEFQKIHYFAVESWEGEIENNEAEALLWIPFSELERLGLDVDRVALGEYMRVFTTPGR
jgi:8-oxo-dGTP diphosphatase